MNLTIFDCDGVLVNSEEIQLSAELQFLNSIGATFEPNAYMHSFMGLSPSAWRLGIRSAVEQKTGVPLPQNFFDLIDNLAADRIRVELAALPHARYSIEQITTLRCVASSSPSTQLRWKLDRAGLIDLFEPHIFSSDVVKNGKPSPDLFLHAAETMRVQPKDCVVVEDSANGVLAGKAAGMKVIGFTAAKHCTADHGDNLLRSGADMIISRYEDLGAALERFCSR